MIVGFTGTREGMTPQQRARFREVTVELKPQTFVHGGAVGADTDAHKEMLAFIEERDVEIFPGGADRELCWRIHAPGALVLRWTQPLTRNRAIVARATYLIACPHINTEELRSGTWMTVRTARKAGKPIIIIWPDGRINFETDTPAAQGESL